MQDGGLRSGPPVASFLVGGAAVVQSGRPRPLSGGLVMAVAALDVTKAYDSVWHAGLLYQCREVLPDSTSRWIAGFLRARAAAVLESGALSAEFPTPGGVPQGSPLSHLLYVIFTMEMPLPRGTADWCRQCRAVGLRRGPGGLGSIGAFLGLAGHLGPPLAPALQPGEDTCDVPHPPARRMDHGSAGRFFFHGCRPRLGTARRLSGCPCGPTPRFPKPRQPGGQEGGTPQH